MNLDPQAMQALMGAGANDPQADILKRQQAQINMMRQRSMQSPQGQMAGRVYVPGFAQAAMGVAQGYKANQMQPQVDQGMQAMGQRNTDARSKYADALMMAMRKQYPQPSSPMLPPDGMEDR
jgi:hypothetical protein